MKYYHFTFNGIKYRAFLSRRNNIVIDMDDGVRWMPNFGVPGFAILAVLNLAKIDHDVAKIVDMGNGGNNEN